MSKLSETIKKSKTTTQSKLGGIIDDARNGGDDAQQPIVPSFIENSPAKSILEQVANSMNTPAPAPKATGKQQVDFTPMGSDYNVFSSGTLGQLPVQPSAVTRDMTSLDYSPDEGIFSWNGKRYGSYDKLRADMAGAGLTEQEQDALNRKLAMYGFDENYAGGEPTADKGTVVWHPDYSKNSHHYGGLAPVKPREQKEKNAYRYNGLGTPIKGNGGTPASQEEPEEPQMTVEEYQDLLWSYLSGMDDFEQKSQFISTYSEDKVSWSPYSRTFANLGADDPVYEYINGQPEILRNMTVQDAATYTTHDYLYNLPERTVKIYNYLYATEGPDAANEYIDAVVEKTYVPVESFAYGLLDKTGIESAATAIAQVIANTTGDEDLSNRNKEMHGEFLKDFAGAQKSNPTAYNIGGVSGNLALMFGIGNLTGGALAKTGLSGLGRGIASGALSMGGRTLVQEMGSAATGYIDPNTYAYDILQSGVAGGAGGLVSSAISLGVTPAGAAILDKFHLSDNAFAINAARTVSAGMSGAGFAGAQGGVNRGINAMRGIEQDEGSLIMDMVVGFAFAAVGSLTNDYTNGKASASPKSGEDEALLREIFGDDYATKTPDEIKAAYRSLSKQYHPDLHPGDTAAAEMMNKVNAAYDLYKNIDPVSVGASSYKAAQEAKASGDTAAYEEANADFREAVDAIVALSESGALSPDVAEAVQVLQNVAAGEAGSIVADGISNSTGGVVAAVTGDIPSAAEQIAPLDTVGDLASPQDVTQGITTVTLPSDVAAPVAGDLEAKVDEAVRTGFDTDAILNMDAINKLTPAEAQAIIDMFDGKSGTPATTPATAPASGLPAKAPAPAADTPPTRTAPAIPAAADVKQENISTVAELAAYLGKAGQKVVTEMYSPSQDPAEYYKAMNDFYNIGKNHPDASFPNAISSKMLKIITPAQAEAAFIAGQADAPKATAKETGSQNTQTGNVERSDAVMVQDMQAVADFGATLGKAGETALVALYDPYSAAATDYLPAALRCYQAGQAGRDIPEDTGALTAQQAQAMHLAGQADAERVVDSGAVTAYNDANKNIETEGLTNEQELRVRESGQRDNGAYSGGEIRAVAGNAGQNQIGRVQARPADGGTAGLSYGQEVSAADIGTPGGSTAKTLRIVTGGDTEYTKEARAIANERGLELTLFSGGNLELTKNGKPISAGAFISGKRAWVRVDHQEYTADQFMRHEAGHDMIDSGEINPDDTRSRLEKMVGPDGVQRYADMYAMAYSGSGLTPDEVWKECICDSLGDMNIFRGTRFEAEAAEYGAATKQAAQADRASRSGRGPPDEAEGHASRATATFLKHFTGRVRDDTVFELTPTELATISSNIKSGMARFDKSATRGLVTAHDNRREYTYLFRTNSDRSVTVVDVFNPDADKEYIDHLDEEMTEYGNAARSGNRKTPGRQGYQPRSVGNDGGDHARTGQSGGVQSMDGGTSAGDQKANHGRGRRDSADGGADQAPVSGKGHASQELEGVQKLRDEDRALAPAFYSKAERIVEGDERYQRNVEALKKVIPADIAPDDISVRLGATWVPDAVYSSFASEMLGAGTTYVGGRGSVPAVEVTYNRNVGKFFVTVNDPWVKSRPENTTEWGTSDRPFVGSENKSILAAALNNKTVTVWRTVGDQRVMDVQATQAAQEKMAKVLGEFSKWLWKDDTRRTELAALYNDTFNNTVTPKYDGSSLTVIGSNPDMPMRPHQLDAVQRIITSGGNTLLAHRVGAGKTYEMAAAAMKLRQLGIVKKPLIIAPNHVVAQWGKEFLDYFPAAKIKVVEKGSVTAKNRKIFANQVATGDYDAIIMSYEQFEAIPMSVENQEAFYQQQIDNLEMAILESKRARGKDPSVRDMERSKKAFEAEIRGIAEKAKRDVDNIDFEQLGVDALFVDEAHNFKNLFYTTKMQGVADLGNKTGSTRAFDLYMKVRYLQGLNGGRGIVFATATPVMNSVVELYTMQRYLQPDLLEAKGITNFDAWANQFGEVTAIRRMKASGTGYDIKQSLSKYKNMAEMQQMFRAFADVIVDAEDLPYLDIPKMKGGKRIVVECEPGEFQHEFMQELSERAEKLKGSGGTKGGDHIFKIMGDGKMVSYSQHMIDPSLPYEDEGKIMKCVQNVYKLWESSATFTGKDGKTYKNGTQLVFCDRGVPGGTDAERGANIYGDMKNLLVGMGVPAEQIAFIHDADSDEAKAELFKKVNDGDVRILFGSSAKMGTGVNCQRRIVAMHELNAPDRPGDLEQNEGRGIRQKNLNGEVEVYSYVTKRTFDSRQWDTLKRKAIFIHQVMAGDFNGREAAGDGDLATSAAEISAIASDNPLILEQFDISEKISNLENLERAHTKEVNQAKERIKTAQKEIAQDTEYLKRFKNDLARRQETAGDKFKLTLDGKTYTERKAAGEALIAKAKSVLNVGEAETYTEVGSFAGFTMLLTSKGDMLLRGDAQYRGSVNMQSAAGTMQALEAIPKRIDNMIAATETRLSENTAAIAKLEKAAAAPFDHADELTQLRAREMEILAELSPAGETDMGADADEDDGDDREVKRFVQKFREKGSKKAGTKIVAGMSDKQRYEILKDRTLPAPRYDHTKLKKVNADLDGMDHLSRTDTRKLLRTLGEQFDVFKQYENKDIDVRFTFSRSNLRESLNKQKAGYSNYAKMMTVFDQVIESAVGIEAHGERYNSPDSDLDTMYVLMSAFRTQTGVVPVLMEVKAMKDNRGNVLYLTVSMHEIKEADIVAYASQPRKANSYAPSAIGFRIADIIRNVNVEDGDLLKYLPDGFLDEAQRAAKQEALKKQIAYIAAKNAKNGIKYSRNSGDRTKHPEEWTTTRVGDESKRPHSLSYIMEKFRRNIGVNITEGHIRGADVRGQFDPRTKGIREKYVNDLSTATHELGHYFDFQYSLISNADQGVIDELLGNLDDEMKEKYEKAELEGEGLAEFFRRYLQNSVHASNEYPKTVKYFLNSLNAHDRVMIEQFADEVNAYYSLDADTAASSVRLYEEGAHDLRTVKEKAADATDWLRLHWVDSNHGIKRVSDAVGSRAYILATNSSRAPDIVQRMITGGGLVGPDGEYIGPGLKAALEGIDLTVPTSFGRNLKKTLGMKYDDLPNCEYKYFGEYLTLRTGINRLARGIQVYADDRKDSIPWMQRRQAELERQYPQFKTAAERLYKFKHDFNKAWLVDTGLLSEEALARMEEIDPDHVPLYRVFDTDGGKNGVPSRRGYANQKAPIKRAVGSGRDIYHPVDNLIRFISSAVTAGVNNRVWATLSDDCYEANATFLEKIPTPMKGTRVYLGDLKAAWAGAVADSGLDDEAMTEMDKIINGLDDFMIQFSKANAKGDIVTVMKNGEAEYWKINDPVLLDNLLSLKPAELPGFMKLFARLNRVQVGLTTGWNVIWSIFSNAPKDLQTAIDMMPTEMLGENRLIGTAKLLKEIVGSWVQSFKEKTGKEISENYRIYLSLGGGGSAVWRTTDENMSIKARRELNSVKKRLNAQSAVSALTGTVTFVSDAIEQGPRFALFNMLMNNGVDAQTAFYMAMDYTVNFRKQGTKARYVNMFVPFFTANIGGVDKAARYYTASDMPRGERAKSARNRIIYKIVSCAAIGLLYAMYHLRSKKAKENYTQLSNYTKNSYWLFDLEGESGKYVALPKNRELSIPASFFEALIMKLYGDDEKRFNEFDEYVLNNAMPPVVDDLAKIPLDFAKGEPDEAIDDLGGAAGTIGTLGTFIDLLANRDFLGRPIVSKGEMYYESKDQFNDRTSKLAHWFGQAFNLSPKQIDYLLSDLTPMIGKYNQALFPLDPKNRDWTLGVRNTYIKDNQYSTDLVNRLYDRKEASAKASKSDPDNIDKKITAKMDEKMTTFYGNYYGLAKSQKTETELSRGVRQTVLEMIREYEKAAEAGTTTRAQEAVYDVVRKEGSTEFLPSVMETSVKDGNKVAHKLSAAQYVEFQTDYNRLYWEYVERNLGIAKTQDEKVAVLRAAKEVAATDAKDNALKRIGAPISGDHDKYYDINANTIVQFRAKVKIANADGSVTQDEATDILDGMNIDDETRALLWQAVNKQWSTKNNPWSWYLPDGYGED